MKNIYSPKHIALAAAAVGTILTGSCAAATTVAAAAPAPTPAAANTAEQNGTRGTAVSFKNDTGHSVWVREYSYGGAWQNAMRLDAGDTVTMNGNWPGTDDVEFRIYPTLVDAEKNNPFTTRYVQVDAENPAVGYPYMVVDWKERSFGVHENAFWYTSYGTSFWGKRHPDSMSYKVFELHLKDGFTVR